MRQDITFLYKIKDMNKLWYIDKCRLDTLIPHTL